MDTKIKRNLKFGKVLAPLVIKSRFRSFPLWAHLFVTRKCNLSCPYCFIKDNSKDELDLANMELVVDRLHNLGVRIISFYGGEPTIRKDFPELVKYTCSKGMITHVSTNGTKLDKQYIDRLAGAGIDIINLSVDSVLDTSRKDMAHSKRVLEDLLIARDHFGFVMAVNMVLTSQNVGSALETIRTLGNYDIPVSICPIVKNTYNSVPQDQSLFFNTPKERAALYGVLRHIEVLRKSGIKIIDPPQYFRDVKSFMEGVLKDWDCTAGEYSISVDVDGRIQFCCGLQPENISIFDLVRGDLNGMYKARRDAAVARCKKVCIGNCHYDASYLIRHPMSVIKTVG
ncbi:MAG: radical SAM protein [Dehalococcoidales bacterium]|nr:radical SAM protein [Dehalococcoidales bacterium]